MRNLLFSVLLALVAPGANAWAYPLNPWGSVVAERTFAYNQYGYLTPGPAVPVAPYLAYGFGSNVDVFAGASFTLAGGGQTSFGTVELFPRYFIAGKVGISPHLLWNPGASTLVVAPEVHWFGRSDRLALTVNSGWRPSFGYGPDGGFGVGTVFAVVVPEVFVTDGLAMYVEFHDYFDAGARTNGGLLVPGVWFALDAAQHHSLAVAGQLGVPVVDTIAAASSLGVLYSATFGR